MPDNDKEKRAKQLRVVAIIGALTALIAALTPGFLAWMENAGAKAKLAQAQGEKADAKADVAYDLLKERLERQDKDVDDVREDVRDLRSDLREIIRIQMMGSGRRGEMPSGGLAGISSLGAGGGGAAASMPKAEPPPAPVAKQEEALPDNLEKKVQDALKIRRSGRGE